MPEHSPLVKPTVGDFSQGIQGVVLLILLHHLPYMQDPLNYSYMGKDKH
jgi:hypothetical protein